MPRTLKRLTLAALAASLCVTAAAAQTPGARTAAPKTQAADTWVTVRPAGEAFAVLMSKRPVPTEQSAQAGGLYAVGRRYAAAADARTTFAVWSLKETTGAWSRLGATDASAEGVGRESLYLDRVAGLAWELLGEPEFDRLRRDPEAMQRAAELELGMSYVRDFELNGRPAREYYLSLEKERGPVYITADGAHVYVLAGLGEDARDPRLRMFADSFVAGGRPHAPGSANPILPRPATIEIDPVLIKPDPRDEAGGRPPTTAQPEPNLPKVETREPPRGNTGGGDAPAGLDGPFRHTEVTRKAIIIFKPEPGFTEEARRFNVTGVVRLRGILGAAGEVRALSVVKTLPHGLTRKALNAARSIRFQPAQKDGRSVSQYVVLEYNFNIY